MREDPFVILGIKRGATQNEIYEAYKKQRARFSEDLFKEGETGAEAAKMLQKLDLAYAEAIEETHRQATVTGTGESTYAEIRADLSNKNIDAAQLKLDSISRRDAEWHYLYSIVYYEKNWFQECKKQLEIACDMEPDNQKYKKALDNLNAKMSKSGKKEQFETSTRHYGATGATNGRSYAGGASRRSGDAADGCCTACYGLLCADCCCECLGGDLIRCC